MSFLTRFRRLERARAEPEPARSPAGDRFEALEPVAPLPDSQSAQLDRFARPVGRPVALELQPRSDGQPFVRCPACGVDSAPGSRRCPCGAALDTLAAVALNARLWDQHRSEHARHETDEHQRRAAQIEAARSLQQERRTLGEEIAREVAARERGRPGGPATVAWALIVLGTLTVLLLPHRPVARLVLAALLGMVAVRSVVTWARSRSGLARPGDDPTVRH